MTNLKRPWCWERLMEGGEGDDRIWDGWMSSPTQWTWVCVNSGSWWWTGKPGVLQSMGSQRVGFDWAEPLNWTKAGIWLQPIDGSVTPVNVCSWMHHSVVNQDYKAEDLEHRDGGCLSSSFSQYCSLLLAPVQPWITDPWRKAIKDFQEQMESLVWWSNPCCLNSPLRSHLVHPLSWLKLAG